MPVYKRDDRHFIKMSHVRSRAYLITTFDHFWDESQYESVSDWDDVLSEFRDHVSTLFRSQFYWTGQCERAPTTGKPHLQHYIKFKVQIT